MRWLVVIAVLAGCGTPPPPIVASTPVTASIVSSPGPLIASHGSLACTACHLDQSPAIAAGACIGCHASLDKLHAKPAVRGQACADCHRDHRGARYDARFAFFGGIDRFDHALTGWQLGKGHRVACDRCHPAARAQRPAFTGASFSCGTCHAQPHAGTPFAKPACEACHLSADSWRALSFDHDEAATPIGASHRHVACASCHTAQLGTKAPASTCVSCHAARDPHAGRFAKTACEKCHAPTMSFRPGDAPPAWKPNAFDHKATGWALTGRHSVLPCRSCHSLPGANVFAPVGAGNDCLGCHEHRNVHDKKYANHLCLRCHVSPGTNYMYPTPKRPIVHPTPSP